jgi:hypothetical protein
MQAIAQGFIGITPTSPTFETVHVQPQVGTASVNASLRLPTVRGFIEADVAFEAAVSFQLELSLPANTQATVCVWRLADLACRGGAVGACRAGAVGACRGGTLPLHETPRGVAAQPFIKRVPPPLCRFGSVGGAFVFE